MASSITNILWWQVYIYFVILYFLKTTSTSEDESDEKYLEPFLNQKYKLSYCDDNFDAVMKAAGVGFFSRHLATIVKPTMELSKEGDEYTLAYTSTFDNMYTKFKIGEDVEWKTPDGRKSKSTFYQDKNILTEIQNYKDAKITITREFSEDQVKVTSEVAGITCLRIYKLHE